MHHSTVEDNQPQASVRAVVLLVIILSRTFEAYHSNRPFEILGCDSMDNEVDGYLNWSIICYL
jgi:hypothetical protein